MTAHQQSPVHARLPRTMLYPTNVLGDRYLVPEMDFVSYFKRNYNALPSFHDLVASGGFKGCCGGEFVQTETGVFETTFFDETRKLNIISWSTKNFKGEDRVCAVGVFEILPSTAWYLWNIAFSTCDPFFFDNFTQPLGLDIEAKRAVFCKETGAICLNNQLPPVEYKVFFTDKIKFMKARMHERLLESQTFLNDLRELAMTSRNMDRVFLRMILERHAMGVPTAEIARDLLSSRVGKICSPAEFDKLKNTELCVLRGIIPSLSPQQFYDLYVSALDGLLDYPINLLPEEYKKFGRRLLMTKDDCDEWDRLVFLLMLRARAQLVVDSPFDASLGLGSGARVFCEVSFDDERFAEKTPTDPTDLDRKIRLGDVGPNWFLRVTEKLVAQQEGFLEVFKNLVILNDIDGALRKLTDGTAKPRTGQGLLGLSINLLRAITAGVITIPVELECNIKTMFWRYGIDWSLPILSVGINAGEATTHGTDLLLKLGAPVRDVASA